MLGIFSILWTSLNDQLAQDNNFPAVTNRVRQHKDFSSEIFIKFPKTSYNNELVFIFLF